MKAAIRDDGAKGRFAEWIEPEHYVLERTIPAVIEDHRDMAWAILAPHRSAAWDGEQLVFGAGARRGGVPRNGAGETAWYSYFSKIFSRPTSPRATGRNLPAGGLIASL